MIKINLSEDQINEIKKARLENQAFQYIRRLEVILYRNEWKNNKYIKDKLDISDDSIWLRIGYYVEWWVKALLDIKFSQRSKSKLADHIDKIREYVKNNQIRTLKELQKYIKDIFQIEYSIWHLSRLCKKNEIFPSKNHVQFHEK